MPVAYHNSQFKNWLSPYEFALRQIQQSSPVVSTKHEKSEPLPCGGWVRIFCIKRYFLLSFCVCELAVQLGSQTHFAFRFRLVKDNSFFISVRPSQTGFADDLLEGEVRGTDEGGVVLGNAFLMQIVDTLGQALVGVFCHITPELL